jgi:hypothetical protein
MGFIQFVDFPRSGTNGTTIIDDHDGLQKTTVIIQIKRGIGPYRTARAFLHELGHCLIYWCGGGLKHHHKYDIWWSPKHKIWFDKYYRTRATRPSRRR